MLIGAKIEIVSWTIEDNYLRREFKRADFVDAVKFVNQITPLAEEMNHHPDILIFAYRRVRVMLRTHSENKITDLDYELAKRIDELAAR